MTSRPESLELLEQLVDSLVRRGVIRTPAVEAAFRAVPRHVFLPGVALDRVYRDDHVTTKEKDGLRLSSSTAPGLMAGMLEQLQPRPGERILEIGAGTGYNAAILARLVGESGRVLTVDIDPEVVDGAREALARFGHGPDGPPPGSAPIEARCADGLVGDADSAPWDRILVTVRAGEIAPAWIEQLAADGRLVVPLALRGARHGQLSIAFERRGPSLESLSFLNCGFIRPRGGMKLSGRELELASPPGLLWGDVGGHALGPEEIRALLESPPRRLDAELSVDRRALIEDFQVWLVVHDPDTCSLLADGPWADWPKITPMVEIPGRLRGTGGLFDGRGIALLGFPDPASHRLHVASHGDPACAERLLGHLNRWHRAGRPGRTDLRIRVFPTGTAPATPQPAAPQPATPQPAARIQESWGELWVDWKVV